jgi:FSR family fosmidomycin resistance protein-like MFS transporter
MSAPPVDTLVEQPEIIAEPHRAIEPPAPQRAAPISRVSARYWTVFISHITVDLFPIFLVSLGPALKARLLLSDQQYAIFFAIGPVISGLSQPLFAWISDRYNTRILGPLGLCVAALTICSIGFAQNFWQLIALQIIGMTGVGVYHPIGSAVAGKLSRGAMSRFGSPRKARGIGLSIFFTGGMIGGFVGPFIASGINAAPSMGMNWLLIIAAPSLLIGWAMWVATRRVQHASPATTSSSCEGLELEERVCTKRQWATVWLLLAINSCRFTTNIGLYFLFTRWAILQVDDGAQASILSAKLLSASTLGMAVAGLTGGWIIAAGREKIPFILLSLITAPVIAFMPFVGFELMLAFAFIAALGFFMPIPPAIGLAQRLLPHATGATGSLLMGCGWAFSALGPLGLGWLIAENHAQPLRDLLGMTGLELGFLAAAIILATAGLLSCFLPTDLLESSARHEDDHV